MKKRGYRRWILLFIFALWTTGHCVIFASFMCTELSRDPSRHSLVDCV